jgi:asparagine synthase (glutamine-hydrolysing)
VSVQFGRWNLDGRPLDRAYLVKAGEMLAPYGPDRQDIYIKDSVGIRFHAFHTTKESRREAQPHITPSGAVLTWDGRLDNRAELVGQLKDNLAHDSTDVAIVAAAHEEWGTGCFARFVGDWALSLWNPDSRSLLLAKDPIGTRHLYYSFDRNRVTWSTILDPLVLLAEKSFALEEEYIAGWLSFFPATHLTPYIGIHAVPQSCFVRLDPGKRTVTKFWDFDPSYKILYRADAEYEEHFRFVFAESVRRRLRSDGPILAELSGGMDSSSIVCVADRILAGGTGETSRLDTISYYDDSEPNWDERPYFTKVEEKRGRAGCHVDVASQEFLSAADGTRRFMASPGSRGAQNRASRQFFARLTSNGNRVVLSGLGGDEVAGGVPTPTPELENLLARARFGAVARQLKAWALNKRKPWFHLLFEAARAFFPSALGGVPDCRRPAPWLTEAFVERNRRALRGYERRLKLFGPLPSFQENVSALDVLRRQLACVALPSEPPYEKRYPYLDRGVLEFLYAVPRDQLVRPGQRRSLQRRALAGIVPDEILNRKRKACVARTPLTAISREWPRILEMSQNLKSGSLGIVEPAVFTETILKARQGQAVPIVWLLRTVGFEMWLRNLSEWRVVPGRERDIVDAADYAAPTEISAEKY